MKIAYILNPEVIVSNKSNGVRSQAEDWGKMLEERGHIVEYVNSWGNYDWKGARIFQSKANKIKNGKEVLPINLPNFANAFFTIFPNSDVLKYVKSV